MRCTVIPLVKIVSRCRRLGNEALPQHIVRRVFKNFLSIEALRTVSLGELGRIISNRVGGQKYGARLHSDSFLSFVGRRTNSLREPTYLPTASSSGSLSGV